LGNKEKGKIEKEREGDKKCDFLIYLPIPGLGNL
jgi:hypothetical protein